MKPRTNASTRTMGAALVALLAATANPGVAGTVHHGIGQTATAWQTDPCGTQPPAAPAGRGAAATRSRSSAHHAAELSHSADRLRIGFRRERRAGIQFKHRGAACNNRRPRRELMRTAAVLRAGRNVGNQHNLRLWVANFGSSDLRMFLVGATTSSMTLVDTDNFNQKTYTPLSVSFDKFVSHFLYAADYQDTMGGPGNIEVWPPGSQSCRSHPKYYLTDPKFANVFFVSNDRLGNLYVDYIDVSGVAHVCFIRGRTRQPVHRTTSAAPQVLPPATS